MRRAEHTALAPFSIMVSHYDLKEKCRFYAGEDVGRATMLEFVDTDNLDELVADFDDLRRGLITERRLCAGGDESIGDATRVPAGAGLFPRHHLRTVHGARPALGRPALGRDQGGDRRSVRSRTTASSSSNLTSDNIIARKIVSPVDLERSSPNSMMRGDVHGVAPYFYQSAGHRPTPDLGQYTVPGVDRLYLAGPFQHPGGGVYGAGRATAIRMFEQLGMDFSVGRSGRTAGHRCSNVGIARKTSRDGTARTG